jgi:dTDP-4-dehydrorhamnose reductase
VEIIKSVVKYLVLGANGLIGKAITRQLADRKEWVGTCFRREEPGLICLDITLPESLESIFSRTKPQCVINCTGLSGGVDFCEKNPETAARFHLDATKSIGKLCEDYHAAMAFISTDYIFDGSRSAYKEDDEPHPLNKYGELKLNAEQWIKQNVSRHIIARTTNVFGWDPETVTPNYIMSLYRAVTVKNQFKAPSFLWGNPTYVDDLASAIIELYSLGANGVFHVVGSSFINRYDWALKACNLGYWDKSLVTELKTAPDNMVPRPLKSNLDTSKFRNLCKTKLRDVDGGLKAFFQEAKIKPK